MVVDEVKHERDVLHVEKRFLVVGTLLRTHILGVEDENRMQHTHSSDGDGGRCFVVALGEAPFRHQDVDGNLCARRADIADAQIWRHVEERGLAKDFADARSHVRRNDEINVLRDASGAEELTSGATDARVRFVGECLSDGHRGCHNAWLRRHGNLVDAFHRDENLG